jgi:hypothetical protein
MCRYCFRDADTGRLVCDAPGGPVFITVPEAREFIIKCNAYKHRPVGEPPVPRSTKGAMYDPKTGLYAGQFAPPEVQQEKIHQETLAKVELAEKGLCDT